MKKFKNKINFKNVFKNLFRKIFSSNGKKIMQKGSYSVGITVVVIAVIVVINLIVSEIPSQYTEFDMSTQKLYTLTDDTKDYIKTLDKDITIYYIVQSGQEDDNIQKILERYDDYSDKITVKQKDPVVNPNFTSKYTDSTVNDNSVIVVCGDRSKVVNYSDMYETSVDYSTYSTQTTGFDAEGQITSALEYVTSENLPKLYTLEGHGEAEISDSFTSAINKENIDVETLNLVTEESVPDDADCLMILSPTSDISSEEAEKITNYLEAGGNAVIYTDYNQDTFTNLESVLQNYGMETGTGVIMEGDTNHYAAQTPYYIIPNVESGSDITSSLSEDGTYLLMPAAQSIQETEEVRDTVTLTPLLTTTDSSYTKVDAQNMETYEKEDGDIDGPFNVGMLATEESGDETTNLVYFTSSSLLNDQVDELISGGDTKLLTSTLSYLCKSDDDENTTSISIAAKSTQTQTLSLTAFDAYFWMVVTIFIIPAACLIIGLVIWLRRRKR